MEKLIFEYNICFQIQILHGSALDIFCYTEVRNTERAIIKEYQQLIDGISNKLTAENYADILKKTKHIY